MLPLIRVAIFSTAVAGAALATLHVRKFFCRIGPDLAQRRMVMGDERKLTRFCPKVERDNDLVDEFSGFRVRLLLHREVLWFEDRR